MPYTRERIAPTGSTVGIVVLGDALLQAADDGTGERLRATCGALIGPHDRPVVNQPTGETHAIGIVTTPVGCETVFGVAPSTIRGRVVDLCSTWSPATRLRTELCAADEPDRMLELVADRVRQGLGAPPRGVERCEVALGRLVADPTLSIAQVAADVGVGREHLGREFTRIVGLTPRTLSRLLRMRRLLAGIDVHGAVAWRELAADLGWFDQAHLIRDFRRHTGVTPTDYLEAQRAGFTDVEAEDAAGFVPES